MTSYFDGVSGNISYIRSVAGQITSVTNQSYTDQYNTPNLVSTVTNGVYGPTNWTLGNGTSAVQSYDSLGRPNGGWVCIGNAGNCQSAYCANNSQLHGYTVSWSGGLTTGMCDTVIQCQNHGYDDLGRLTAVNGTSSSFSYSYDRWGNRTAQNGAPSVTYSFDQNTNHNNSFGYDAAGNQTNDSSHQYTYDAEGKVLQVDSGATATYTYDAQDRRVRVQASGGTDNEFMFDPFDRRISSWIVASNSGNEGRIYWDGGLLANRAWNGTTYFHHSDWQGTERFRTDWQGNAANGQRSWAFGDGFSQDSSDIYGAAQDNNQFAEQEYDAETNTDHALYRQYSPTAGRWFSPDPYDGSYDLSDPQSFNRYTYVNNLPFSATDPSGLDGTGGIGGAIGGCIGVVTSGGHNPVADLGCAAEAIKAALSFFLKPTFHGSLTPRPEVRGATYDDPWNESLGYPKGGPTLGGNWGIAGALGVDLKPGCEFGACRFQSPAYPNGHEPSMNPIPYLWDGIVHTAKWAWHKATSPVVLSYEKDLPSCFAVGAATLWNEGVMGTADPTPSPINVTTGILGHQGVQSRLPTGLRMTAGQLLVLQADLNVMAAWKKEMHTPCK